MNVAHGVERHEDNLRLGVLVLFKEGGHSLPESPSVANVAEFCRIGLARGDETERCKGLADARRRHLEGGEIRKGFRIVSPHFENVHEGLAAAVYIVDCFKVHLCQVSRRE